MFILLFYFESARFRNPQFNKSKYTPILTLRCDLKGLKNTIFLSGWDGLQEPEIVSQNLFHSKISQNGISLNPKGHSSWSRK